MFLCTGGQYGGQYGSMPRDQGMTAPGGKQVYQSSQQEWDGNKFTQKTTREESQSYGDGRGYQQMRQVGTGETRFAYSR